MVQWFVENDPDQLTKVNMMGTRWELADSYFMLIFLGFIDN
jgi:hypothetical protein